MRARANRPWIVWMALAWLMVTITIALTLGLLGSSVAWFVLLPGGLALSCFYIAIAKRRRVIQAVRIAANACSKCGYSLTGLQPTRCPECGTENPLVAPSAEIDAQTSLNQLLSHPVLSSVQWGAGSGFYIWLALVFIAKPASPFLWLCLSSGATAAA